MPFIVLDVSPHNQLHSGQKASSKVDMFCQVVRMGNIEENGTLIQRRLVQVRIW